MLVFTAMIKCVNKHRYRMIKSQSAICEIPKRQKLRYFAEAGYTDEQWHYGQDILAVVDKFNYLGTVLKNTGSFTENQETIV